MKRGYTNRYRQPRLDEIKRSIKHIRIFPIPLLIPFMLLPFLGHSILWVGILLIPAISCLLFREMSRSRIAGGLYQKAIRQGWRRTKNQAQTDARFRNLLILFASGLLYLFLLYPPLGILGTVSAAYFVLITPDLVPPGKNREGGRS